MLHYLYYNQGRAQDLGFWYSIFLKDEIFFGRHYPLRYAVPSDAGCSGLIGQKWKGEVELGWIGVGWGLLLGLEEVK